MKLWSFQPKEVYEHLKEVKVLPADPLKGDHYNDETSEDGITWPGFKDSYAWLENQYSQRIKDGELCSSLWWAWAYKPDLRRERLCYPDGDVLLELEVPDCEVLLSNFNGWCMGPLNGGFISRSGWEDSYFEFYRANLPFDILEDDPEASNKSWKLEQESGLYNISTCITDEDWKEHINGLVEESWNRIFDVEFGSDCEEGWCGTELEQANFEFLKLEYVKKVREFKGRT